MQAQRKTRLAEGRGPPEDIATKSQHEGVEALKQSAGLHLTIPTANELDPAVEWKGTAATVLDPDNLNHYYFQPALTRAGLRRFRFHDLRHTFGSLLIQDGASLAYVKEQMGHSSIQVTADVYGHLIPGANISWVDRLDVESTPQQNATTAQLAARTTLGTGALQPLEVTDNAEKNSGERGRNELSLLRQGQRRDWHEPSPPAVRFYKCWAGCTKEMIRAALGCPIRVRHSA